MTLRISVTADLKIEIMRPRIGLRSQFLAYPSADRALIVIEFLLKREIEKARGERFVPQIKKEARQAFKQLNERNPYNGKS